MAALDSSTQHQSTSVFRRPVRAAAESPANRDSVIADAYRQCPFPEVPKLLDTIAGHLGDCGVQPSECVTVELANCLPAGLAVLALLDRGHSIMLMPIEGRGARAAGRVFRGPRFSRWIMTVQHGQPLADCDLEMPATYLDVQLNPEYDAGAAQRTQGRSIYLRTSGSLGAPKLAVHTHEHFLANVLHSAQRLRFKPSHRAALPTPIYHAYGLGPAFLGCFLAGASIDLQERANLLRYLEREHVFAPNIAFVTPSFCEILIRGRKSRREYEFVVTGGDRIGRSTFSQFEEMHGPLINGYGSTEMGFIFAADLGMSSEQRFSTVGHPLPGVSFRIIEGSALQLKHEHGFTGYVDLEGSALPRTAFDGEWYRSGDVAEIGLDGSLTILGRSDLSVNRNGLLVTFAELEAVLREIAGVVEAAVAAGPYNIRGRTLVAFCVLGRGVDHSEEDLRAEIAKRAPSFAVPELIKILQELPKLPTGKLDRTSLAAIAQGVHPGPDDAATAVA